VELNRQKYFGEGISFLNGKVYQLTYKSKIGFVYDAKTFKKIGDFAFASKEGWGMTTDGTSLIMSDGTSLITYLQPGGFKIIKSITVSDENGPVANVNELEFIKGFIYANIYDTNNMIKIDTATGKVVGKLDLSSLANEAKVKYPASLEMNGIAYDSTIGKVYVTGKMWPYIFQIEFNH
jgi:glutamine cyclotransferase